MENEKKVSLEEICNNNSKNNPSVTTYKSFNDFIFSNDIKLIGKLLKRFEFFFKIKDLPGDIVELGVYKGSGVATFSKFLQLYCPNAIKKVIGFDLFDTNNDVINNFKNGYTMKTVYNKVDENLLSYDSVLNNLTNLNKDNYELIKGDICKTTEQYSEENPGLRISLLYIDVDLQEPTYYGLKNLWKHIIPGGIILFDEYQYHKFDESNGVDKFLQEIGIKYEIMSTNWLAPDCFMIKKI
jgi:hypothetical protein